MKSAGPTRVWTAGAVRLLGSVFKQYAIEQVLSWTCINVLHQHFTV